MPYRPDLHYFRNSLARQQAQNNIPSESHNRSNCHSPLPGNPDKVDQRDWGPNLPPDLQNPHDARFNLSNDQRHAQESSRRHTSKEDDVCDEQSNSLIEEKFHENITPVDFWRRVRRSFKGLGVGWLFRDSGVGCLMIDFVLRGELFLQFLLPKRDERCRDNSKKCKFEHSGPIKWGVCL